MLVLGSVSLVLEPVVGKNTLPQRMGQVRYVHCDNLPSPDLPRYSYADQSKKENEQLGDRSAYFPSQDRHGTCIFLHRCANYYIMEHWQHFLFFLKNFHFKFGKFTFHEDFTVSVTCNISQHFI